MDSTGGFIAIIAGVIGWILLRRGSGKPRTNEPGTLKEETIWQWESGGFTSSNKYRLTNLAFYASEGGLRKQTQSYPLSRIQSVRVERSKM